MTFEPGAPGIAPLMSRRLFSVSTLITSKFWTVFLTLPIWPAIFLPFQTLPGVWHWPIEPGARWESELP